MLRQPLIMKMQTRHVQSPLPSNVTDIELQDLEARCLAISGDGGEAGEIASEIIRISKALQALTDEAEQFLSRAH